MFSESLLSHRWGFSNSVTWSDTLGHRFTFNVSLSHTFGSIQSQTLSPKFPKLISNFSDKFTDFQVTLPELLPFLRSRYALRGVRVSSSGRTLRDLDWAPERPIAVLLEEPPVGCFVAKVARLPTSHSWNKLTVVILHQNKWPESFWVGWIIYKFLRRYL